MQDETTGDKVILALDGLDMDEATDLAELVGYRCYAVKIHNLYDRYGTAAIIRLKQAGAQRVWVDAKLHDIPKTVELRAKAISDAGADILTVHASGGIEMIKAAVDAFKGEVYAVTVLTSLDAEQAQDTYGRPTHEVVGRFARLAAHGGAHGVVCSPHEVSGLTIRSDIGNHMKFIVPGIRPIGADVGDQKRFDTPRATLRNGAHRLVIGRPITAAVDAVSAFEAIEAEIASAEED